MSNSVIITLIICITIIIAEGLECIYRFITARDNYNYNRVNIEIEFIRKRIDKLERRKNNE